MKVNQTMHIWPRLNPVRLPLVGKCLSMNSATRSLSSSATKTGISSTRSCTAVIFGFIPQAYITSQNHDLIHANVELSGMSNPRSLGLPYTVNEPVFIGACSLPIIDSTCYLLFYYWKFNPFAP